MNEVIKAIKERRSIRKYKPDMIPEETIKRICEAGTYAASGKGKQSPIIIAITDKAIRDRLGMLNGEIKGSNRDEFYGAPVVLVVLADKKYPTYLHDGCAVIMNMLLAAHSEGIGSCWIHRAKEEFETEEGKAILKSLGITGDYEGVGHCILGYPEGEPPKAAPRKENYIYYL